MPASRLQTIRPRQHLRAWRHIAQSALMRRIDEDWIPQPHAAHLLVTYRCNLQCTGCGSWKVREHDDLTAAEWKRVFLQLTSLDIVKVLGGEPFVRKDMVHILSDIREVIDPLMLQMTSNGMVPKKLIEAIHAMAWPGLQLRISVDGTEKTHDRMRGVEGSWKIVNRTVQQVAALKDQYGFRFGINFALTDDSLDDLEPMIAYANALGADLIPGVNVDPFLVGTEPPEKRTPKVIMLSDKEKALRALQDQRVGTRKQLLGIERFLSRWYTRKTFSHQLLQESQQFHCRELRDLIYILPNGDLVRCGLDHRPVGNVREQTFQDIWTGTDIALFRQRVKDCPGCLQASVQILSRLYGGCLL